MSRDPQSVLLEGDYWQLILDDLLVLNDALGAAARPVVSAQVHLFGALVAPDGRDSLLLASGLLTETLQHVSAAQDPLLRIIDLVGGRIAAIRSELEAES